MEILRNPTFNFSSATTSEFSSSKPSSQLRDMRGPITCFVTRKGGTSKKAKTVLCLELQSVLWLIFPECLQQPVAIFVFRNSERSWSQSGIKERGWQHTCQFARRFSHLAHFLVRFRIDVVASQALFPWLLVPQYSQRRFLRESNRVDLKMVPQHPKPDVCLVSCQPRAPPLVVPRVPHRHTHAVHFSGGC